MPTVDLTDVSKSNHRAIAEHCAIHVLGWSYQQFPYDGHCPNIKHWYSVSPCPNKAKDDSFRGALRFNPLDSADDDYAVLVKVRETWDDNQHNRFKAQVVRIWAARFQDRHGCEFHQTYGQMKFDNQHIGPVWGIVSEYEPGDYCVAASRVVQGEDNAKARMVEESAMS